MKQDTWQQLLSLESRDIVAIWFKKIHGRELNALRSKEIVAAAKQAREFFRNSHEANNSVKPLLTFYGVACLARALTLLLKREGGEEKLTKGHGFEAISWSDQLRGDLSVGLKALSELKIRTCAGLFSDFARETKSRMSMHLRSEAVDWRINYSQPDLGDEVLFGDLIVRVPDLHKEHAVLGTNPMYAHIDEMSSSNTGDLNIKAMSAQIQYVRNEYAALGYQFKEVAQFTIMTGDSVLTSNQPPQFMHTYVYKMFNKIPDLYLIAPLPSGGRYSQLCITYMLGYTLGMLARYFPTHWVSLAQGAQR